MNREFQASQFRGVITIIIAIAALALILVSLQLAGGLIRADVPGFDQAQSQSQPVEVAETYSGQRAYALRRSWKPNEIGAGVLITTQGKTDPVSEEETVNLGYFFRVETAGAAAEGASRGWKVDEIGSVEAGSRANVSVHITESDDALNLGSQFEASQPSAGLNTAKTMHVKLERMLAQEAAQPRGTGQVDSCQPVSGTSPEPC